ncbi:hypothetical protein ACFOVS_12050 [Rhizobium lemnae]|uniref:Alpha/beta hydrolase n=1 Tax=Rhizobium lemnae TaxID=1214924 RepID=A0ABV8EAN9_9HYPH
MCEEAGGLILVVLVHGTWGRGIFPVEVDKERRDGPLWFQTGSAFFGELNTKLRETFSSSSYQFEMEPFFWSGANSIRARDRASDHLQEWFKGKLSTKNYAGVLIVAHSHGANLLKKVALTCPNSNVNVVTLGAPFLEVYADNEISIDIGSVWSLCVAVFSIMYFFFKIFPYLFGIDLLGLILFVQSENGRTAIGVLLLFFGSSIAMGIASMFGLDSTERAKSLAAVTKGNLDWSPLKDCGVLILRAVDDEASLVLAAGAIGNRICIVALKIAQTLALISVHPLYLLPVAFCMTMFSFLFVNFGGLFSDPARNLYFATTAFIAIFIFLPGVLYLAALFLSGLFKSTHGRELFLGAINTVLNAQSAPDIHQSARIVTLPGFQRRNGGFRHSVYDHSDCAPTIVEWLANRLGV